MSAPSANDSKRPSASAALDLAPYTDKDQEIARDAETPFIPLGGFEHRFEVPNENRKYNGGAQDVGDAFRIKQAVRPIAEPGEDEAEREQDDELAHHGPEEGELGAPQRHERAQA